MQGCGFTALAHNKGRLWRLRPRQRVPTAVCCIYSLPFQQAWQPTCSAFTVASDRNLLIKSLTPVDGLVDGLVGYLNQASAT